MYPFREPSGDMVPRYNILGKNCEVKAIRKACRNVNKLLLLQFSQFLSRIVLVLRVHNQVSVSFAAEARHNIFVGLHKVRANMQMNKNLVSLN